MHLVDLDARTVRAAPYNDGFLVCRQAVPTEMCAAVLSAIDTELGIRVTDPASWERVSAELDQVPIWGHQAQWDIRQLPALHRLWALVWGTERLWVDRNSCRFTPPWREGRAAQLPLHWDVDPWDTTVQWYPGILALTDSAPSGGGFCCSPGLMHSRDRWPTAWTETRRPTYRAPRDEATVEVPLNVGDVLIFDSHLPHGTVHNETATPRVVFYLSMFPAGSPADAAANIADHETGRAPAWWAWKPGHHRREVGPPATLNRLGRRLLGQDPW